MTWEPFEGAQQEFCERGEFEALYGGLAGPGKTDCLVNIATRYHDNPRYRGLLLRRTYPQLEEIMDRCWIYYSQMYGVYRSQEKRWYFSSGSFIKLGHMQFENDKYNYQGARTITSSASMNSLSSRQRNISIFSHARVVPIPRSRP